MKINTLIIKDEVNQQYPVYEVHSWEKAEEIILATKELMGDTPFTWEVRGSN